MALIAFSLLLFVLVLGVDAQQVDYCVTGFLMDKFCITLGTLFDNPTLASLSYPQNHSVHCLIDVPDCLASGYEVLVPGSGMEYQRVVSLNSTNELLRYSRALGVCPSCNGSGTVVAGLRATVKGTIDASAVFDPLNPPVVTVTSVEPDSVECSAGVAAPAEQEEEYCVTGFLMDTFCITLGTLFDNPTLETLSHPQNHSVHCLIDVPDCLASGYEVLVPGSGVEYQRDVALDSTSLLLAYARSVGVCPSCTGAGTIEVGLQATVKGIIDPSTVNETVPTLMVTSVEDASVGCTKAAAPAVTGAPSTGSTTGLATSAAPVTTSAPAVTGTSAPSTGVGPSIPAITLGPAATTAPTVLLTSSFTPPSAPTITSGVKMSSGLPHSCPAVFAATAAAAFFWY